MAENVPLQGKIFFVARCHLLAALYLNVSRPCATCRIMETRESVQNFAPSPKNQVFEPRIGLHGGGLRPPPCSRTFASTLVTLQICGLIIMIIVVDVELGPGSTAAPLHRGTWLHAAEQRGSTDTRHSRYRGCAPLFLMTFYLPTRAKSKRSSSSGLRNALKFEF